MRSIHILNHSISPFLGQFPDRDPLHYNTGIPMLFGRAIRSRYPEVDVEVWRPEKTLRKPYVWKDGDGITHRVFPSVYVRYKVELSPHLLVAVKRVRSEAQTYVWVHGIYNTHAYVLAPMLSSARAVAQSHGGFPAKVTFNLSERRWLRYLYLPMHPMQKRALPSYPHIFAINSEESRYLQTILSVSAGRITFSPTGIDFGHFCPGPRRAARDACGLGNDPEIVLYVGRLDSSKGVGHLVEAFALLIGQRPNAHLYVVGAGPSEEDLARLSDRLGVSDRVHFVGYVSPDELPNWYRAADLTVMPSLYEWFGKVAAESMACGTPVVATQAGGAIDVVEQFECGVLVPRKDVPRLARAILAVLSGEVNTRPNIDRARQRFDWSVKLSTAFRLFQEMPVAGCP